MSDLLGKHRVIGIKHTIKELRDAGLVSKRVMYPEQAVEEIKQKLENADQRKKPRTTRSDSSIPALIRKIEKRYKLPEGSVVLIYPSGRKAAANIKVGTWLKNWQRANEAGEA